MFRRMFETIHWRCHVRGADRRKVERVVGRMRERMVLPLVMREYERYWKVPELAEVRLESPLGRVGADEALLAALECAWRVATPWSVSAIGPPERREFSGLAAGTVGARFLVPGVEWIEFSLVGGV